MAPRRIGRRELRFAVLVACGTLLAGPVPAGEPLTVRVWPRISMEPATVMVETIVERHPENRALEIALESADFYRASRIQLDGDESPRISSFRYLSLPGGSYVLRTTLFGPGGKTRASVSWPVEVVARSGS
ncbi:MAG TPA: hypothetical protein VNI83_12590 [Vicinamibacterales bacterium]|nr:hypothetical protein [Vicinamibacterales bacterium]